MKSLRAFFGLAAVIIAVPVWAGGSAQVQLANRSVRFGAGSCSCGFGLTWKIRFSTYYTDNAQSANGEVAPLPASSSYGYWSYLMLEDPSTVTASTYAELDLPTGDGDNNGTPDFLEIGQGVSTATSGRYATIWGPGYGQLTFTWNRAAGSASGTCVLNMIDPILGPMGPFTHTFELVNYSGELSYTPGDSSVAATIHLAKAGDPSDWLGGSVLLTKSSTNSANVMTMAGNTWTNDSSTFSFSDCDLTRDVSRPNVYTGLLQIGGSYGSWQVSIVDTNDANANGIPDLSDNVVSTPRRPSLQLINTGTNLTLRLSGDVGRTHRIQEAANPAATSWSTVKTVTLTTDPQLMTIPTPATSPRFWRVEAQ